MKIITGEEAAARFAEERHLEWTTSTFLVEGEGDESPYHQWSLMLYLLEDKSGRFHALQETGLPDPDDDEGEGAPASYLVAVAEDAGTDRLVALRALLATHWQAQGRDFDGFRRTSKLWDLATRDSG